ncbi:MAG: GNAT family N-acetyltransferase [Elusimicrobiota bacterium]|jgi:ribosomal protein S18 acetylase RimI-like enzyme
MPRSSPPALKGVALLLCAALLHASAGPAFAQAVSAAAAARAGTGVTAVLPVQAVQLTAPLMGSSLSKQDLAGSELPRLVPLPTVSPTADAAAAGLALNPVEGLPSSAVKTAAVADTPAEGKAVSVPSAAPTTVPAGSSDAPDISRLLLESAPHFLPASFGPRVGPTLTALSALRENIFSHEHVRLAQAEGKTVGMLLGYMGSEKKAEELRTGTLLLRSLGVPLLGRLPALLRLQGSIGRIPADSFYVSNVAVDPAARGRGIGEALLADAERTALAQGAASLCLDVEADNAGALKLYARLGFTIESTTPLMRIGGRSFALHRMVKPLKTAAAKVPAAPVDGAVERLERGERAFTPEPESFELDKATLKDLQVLTDGGLRSQLDKTRTFYGSQRLSGLLKRPFLDAGEIQRRQEAAVVIASDAALRTRLQTGLDRLKGKADHSLAEHFKSPTGLFIPFILLGVVMGFWLPGSLIIGGWRQLLQGTMVYFMIIGSMLTEMGALRAKLVRYKEVFRFARDLAEPLAKSSSPALRELGGVFSAVSEKRHPLALKKVAGSFLRLLPTPLALLLDALFLWGTKTLWHPIWRLRQAQESVAQLFGALGELDVYLTFAELLASGAPWTLPVVESGPEARLRIEDGHHPIVLALRGKDSTPNDADLRAGRGFNVLTGTNMGGKSTYLRMVALLTLLAQIGAPVPARAMALTPVELLTSVDVGDDLRSGKSLYDAETDRLLKIVNGARTSTRVLAVMDEILQGTNPEERTAAERAVVRYLADTPNLFLVATHNLSIAEVAEEAASLRNFHVAGAADEGVSRYRVLPGPAKDRNGILTLERKGFPESLVRDARSRLEHP